MASDVTEESVLAEPSPLPAGAPEIGVRPHASPEFPTRPPDRKFHLVWLCLAGSVVLLSMVMQIRNSQEVNVPFTQTPLPELCSFRRMTGMDCAGCGMTRCFISLGHGDLPAAWKYNPAGILLYAIVLFQLPYRGWQLWRIHRGQPEIHLGQFAYGAMVLFAVLMVAQWGIKQAALFF
jgi:hypothetical protein